MNRKVISVELSASKTDSDILRFHFDDDNISDIDLNSPNCQNDIKEVFLKLLKLVIQYDVSLELTILDGYTRVLYKEVCTEYIKDISRELSDVTNVIRREMSVQ